MSRIIDSIHPAPIVEQQYNDLIRLKKSSYEELTEEEKEGAETYPLLWFIVGESESILTADPHYPVSILATGIGVTEIGEDEVMNRAFIKRQYNVNSAYRFHPKMDAVMDNMQKVSKYGVCYIAFSKTEWYTLSIDWTDKGGLVLKKEVYTNDDIGLCVKNVYTYTFPIKIWLKENASSYSPTLAIDPVELGSWVQKGCLYKSKTVSQTVENCCVHLGTSLFIQKFGHTEISIGRESGSKGTGQLSTDGYSIGYTSRIAFGKDNDTEYVVFKLRANVSLSNPSAPPAITISVMSNTAMKLEVQCSTTDPALSEASPAILHLLPDQRNEVCFESCKVTTKNAMVEHEEPIPTNEIKAVQAATQDPVEEALPESHLSRLKVFDPIIKSSKGKSNFWLLENYAIGFLKNVGGGANQVLGQVWVGLATEGSTKTVGKDYWYLIGGEEPHPSYRVKTHMSGSINHSGYIQAGVKNAVVKGQVWILNEGKPNWAGFIDFEVSATVYSDEDDKPSLTVSISSKSGFKGYLDIVSEIDFDFYKDGPIKIDLPLGKVFTFSGN